jgi:hypothetical protein
MDSRLVAVSGTLLLLAIHPALPRPLREHQYHRHHHQRLQSSTSQRQTPRAAAGPIKLSGRIRAAMCYTRLARGIMVRLRMVLTCAKATPRRLATT